MKSFSLFNVFVVLWVGISIITNAQNQVINKKNVSIDTLAYIKIDKLIFYQDPLELKYSSIVDKSYIPEWYKAYCASSNYEYFKDYPKEAVGLFHSKSGVTEEMLAEHVKKTEAKGGLLKSKELLPYSYFFGEIWLTYLKTGEQIMITQDYDTDKQIPNLKFDQPVVKENKNKERIDTLKTRLICINAYIFEEGVLKKANQPIVINQMLLNNSTYRFVGNIQSFKDMLYRSPQYIRSVIKNGKRVFETIKNTENGPIVVNTNDKP